MHSPWIQHCTIVALVLKYRCIDIALNLGRSLHCPCGMPWVALVLLLHRRCTIVALFIGHTLYDRCNHIYEFGAFEADRFR
ncbi:MAG: hypothetical protein NT070_23260 [Cyanobacteria bacterium]|nr:hypothetical protein [Cyanobacteriota bacterium]